MLGGLLYGAFHAAGPGHGKAVVASYFLSRVARLGRGLLMGAQISLTHVVSAVLVVAALRYLFGRWGFGNIEDIREIKLASYALIAATGLLLLWHALRARGAEAVDHHHHHHHHGVGLACCSPADSRGGNAAVSLLVGMVPCTGALLVMVYAFANDIVMAGALVALSIAVGMAATMSLIGMAAVFGRRRIAIAGTGSATARRFLSALDLLGPAMIAAVGVGLFFLTY
jgi:ABC-type nickel/cobalt efflux system permease component RcnA